VEEEVAKYGEVVKIVIPRPVGASRQSAGVGKIFVKYQTAEAATKALRALAGRKFSDRTVVTTYFPEVRSSHTTVWMPRLMMPRRRISRLRHGEDQV
jgi:hypothetical protein